MEWNKKEESVLGEKQRSSAKKGTFSPTKTSLCMTLLAAAVTYRKTAKEQTGIVREEEKYAQNQRRMNSASDSGV
jgi:hypothetical protein